MLKAAIVKKIKIMFFFYFILFKDTLQRKPLRSEQIHHRILPATHRKKTFKTTRNRVKLTQNT